MDLTLSHDTLGFRIPEQRSTIRSAFDTRPTQVARWIEQLPLANIGETARLVYGAITETNRLAIAEQQRFKLLELLTEPVDYVRESLKRHYIGQRFPLNAKAAKIAELVRRLQAEMAIGYIIIVNGHLIKLGDRRSNPALAISIHRAIYYLGGALLTIFQTYSRPPGHFWRELHHLYGCAERLELDQREVSVSNGRAIGTIGDIYKRVLLLALADPYRLRQTDLDAIDRELREWSRYAVLVAPGEDAGDHPAAVDLDSDDPPSFSSRAPNGEGRRSLKLDRLVRHIEGRARAARAGDSSVALSHALLVRLLRLWTGRTKRGFTRRPGAGQVEAAIGLSDSCKLLGGATDAGQRATFRSARLRESLQPRDLDDVWSISGPGTSRTVADDEDGVSQAVAPASAQTALHTPFLSINESAGGFCLRASGGVPSQLQVGEVVALVESGRRDAATLGVGLVRWLKQDSLGTELGVQLLAPSAEVVAIASATQGKTQAAYQRALILPAIAAIAQPATLLTPSIYRPNESICLLYGGGRRTLELTQLVENTGVVSRFQFDILADDKETGPKSGTGEPPTDLGEDFESVWNLL